MTNEAGDILEVKAAQPGEIYWKGSGLATTCALTIPFIGSTYTNCGYVYAYDSKLKSSKEIPWTNWAEHAAYDACGKKVSSGYTEGYHYVGYEWWNSGWTISFYSTVPSNQDPFCLGTWTMVYSWTQEFTDGEKLTDTIEAPFTVTEFPVSPEEFWGGGNPAELYCIQQCQGDPVNTATGDYIERSTDLSIPGRGSDLEMSRTYSSLAAKAGESSTLGRGWASIYATSLSVTSTGYATVTNANGSQTEFYPAPTGFIAPPRVLATLVKNKDGTYAYTVRKKTIYTFDSEGRLIAISDLNGEETTLAYDEAGQLESATDGAGRSLGFEYDEEGRLTSVTDSSERSVEYGYDESGYLDEVIDVRGGTSHYTYDENGLLLTHEDPREDTVLTNTYDSKGRVLTQTDGLENETTFSYSGSGTTTTKVTNPRGYVTEYEYVDGALAKRTEAAGTESSASWTYEHDPTTLGVTAITDPNGHTSHATYDESGNQTSTEDAVGNTTESAYDPLGDLIESTDAGGVTTTYEYDENGNLLSSSTPLEGSEPAEARTVAYAHEDEEHPGDVTAVTDPNEHTTTFIYDKAGNMESITDAAQNKITYTYDELGQRLTKVSPRGNVKGAKASEYTTTYTYDAAGNRLSEVDPLGHERKWKYDANGNVEAETDANAHTTTYTYDAANRPIKAKQPNGDLTATGYDANGNVESQTNGLEHATTYTYDPLDSLESSTDPLGRETSYAYDGVGNLVSKIDPDERATTYEYDKADRLTGIDYSEEAAPDVEYGYDKDSRRTSMSDGTGESTYEYDSLGRLTTTEDGHGAKVSYAYDLTGNATAITYPNGKEVTRAFDEAERLESVTDWLGNTTSFAYDADSNPTSTTFPKATGNLDEYGYDRAGAMSEVAMKKGKKEILAALSYTRDKLGQVGSLASEGLPGAEEEAFSYDENDRLIEAAEASYGYDAANNLTKAPGTTNSYDAANQLRAGTGVAYAYDEEGERIEAGLPAATYATSFGSTGTGKGQFEHPAGIEVDGEGNIWVADTGNDRVQKFSAAGEYLDSFGSTGSENGQLERPTDVAIDAKGHIWVADAGNNRIEEFSKAGEYLGQFGSAGSENGQFAEPEGLDIDNEGDIWVADTHNGRLQEFDEEGKFIKVVGESGEGKGQIGEAAAIAVCPGNTVWVADRGNDRVIKFDEEGEFDFEFGTYGSGVSEFKQPGAISVDPAKGDVWVGDEGNGRVQVFDASGEYVGQFGSPGSGAGEFALEAPLGIATDSEGRIWASDAGGDRVEKWSAFEESEEVTAYSYDQAGNLTAVQRPAGMETSAIDETYAYDGTGLRASQRVSETTSYLTWDQSGELPLLLDDGQASYIYGPDGLPIEQIVEGAPTYYHHDQLGSTRMLTNASGETTGTFTFSAYGEFSGSAGTQTTPLGYAGQYTNEQSGLQYLRARVYDPVTGQFLSVDPLVWRTNAPYGYALYNPLNFIDPSGLVATQTCIGGSVSLIITIEANVCYVDTPGGSGLAISGGASIGPGFGANAHAGAGVSNAKTPGEYGGPFATTGAHAEAIVGGYADGFVGPGGNCNSIVVGGTAGVSVGFGAGASAGGSETVVISL